MKYLMCSIRDIAAAAYQRPFAVPTEGFASRLFSDEVNRNAENNPMYAHPGDFELFVIGTFDEETGTFGLYDGAPKSIARGREVSLQRT